MLCEARWKTNGLGRGMLRTSKRELCKRFKYMSLSGCGRMLDRMVDLEMIEIEPQPGRKMSHLSICNYDKYQVDEVADEPQVDRKRTTTEPRSEPSKKEGLKKKGNKEKISRACALPKSFQLDDDLKRFAADKGYSTLETNLMFEKFCNHHTAKGSTFKSWPAAWRTWVGNQTQWSPPKGATQSSALDRLRARAARKEQANG
jgi:hypothetical protein